MPQTTWKRLTDLGWRRQPQDREVWQYWRGDTLAASFEVVVTCGKPLDILALKGTSLESVRDYAAFLRQTARQLYAPDKAKRNLPSCPCCAHSTATAAALFPVFGVHYHRCGQCGHVFVLSQPTQEDVDQVFTESEEHAAVYVDKDSLETRLASVIAPKLTWVAETYQRLHARPPQTVVDVGAGGGHFVELCRRRGLNAAGYEISRASRNFAREAFGLELIGEDFLLVADLPAKLDLITFWGLLEYTPEPKKFLHAARRLLHPGNGLLIVEVPRFDCLGSAAQQACPDTVARHLDPTSHLNVFSDASLATALVQTGFRPVAAWYFGMDIYELLMQLALKLQNEEALARWADLIPRLQTSLDGALLCDDIVVAAVPWETETPCS